MEGILRTLFTEDVSMRFEVCHWWARCAAVFERSPVASFAVDFLGVDSFGLVGSLLWDGCSFLNFKSGRSPGIRKLRLGQKIVLRVFECLVCGYKYQTDWLWKDTCISVKYVACSIHYEGILWFWLFVGAKVFFHRMACGVGCRNFCGIIFLRPIIVTSLFCNSFEFYTSHIFLLWFFKHDQKLYMKEKWLFICLTPSIE